jgi:copper chaperone CopZ
MRGFAVWMIVGVVLACGALTAAAADSPTVVRTTFQVQGMHCNGCTATIVGTLERIDGVDSATADHEEGVAEAVYRTAKVDAEDLEAAIEKLGYTVTSKETEKVEGWKSEVPAHPPGP